MVMADNHFTEKIVTARLISVFQISFHSALRPEFETQKPGLTLSLLTVC